MTKNIVVKAEADGYKLAFEIPVLFTSTQEQLEEANSHFNEVLKSPIEVYCHFLQVCVELDQIGLVFEIIEKMMEIAEREMGKEQKE